MKKSINIPNFTLYGESTPGFDSSVQPLLALRNWSDITSSERKTALQQLVNKGWIDSSREILRTVSYLNETYLRVCPGKNLHAIRPERGSQGSNYKQQDAAVKDFYQIFSNESDPLVLRMLSKLAQCYIDGYYLQLAADSTNKNKRSENLEEAFSKFDRFANCINHIFEQYAINQMLTRNGFVPRQDDKIDSSVYAPTLAALVWCF